MATKQYWLDNNNSSTWNGGLNWSDSPNGSPQAWMNGDAYVKASTNGTTTLVTHGNVTLTGLIAEGTGSIKVESIDSGKGGLFVAETATFARPSNGFMSGETFLNLPIIGSGDVVFEGGAFVLGGQNTYTGGTTVSQSSTVSLHAHGSLPDGGYLYVGSEGRFSFKESTTTNTIGALAGEGTIILGAKTLNVGAGMQAGQTSVFSGHFEDSLGSTLVKKGEGKLELNGSYTTLMFNNVEKVQVDQGELVVHDVSVLGNTTQVKVDGKSTFTVDGTDLKALKITADSGVVKLDNASALGAVSTGPFSVPVNPSVTLNGDAELVINAATTSSSHGGSLKQLTVAGGVDTQISVNGDINNPVGAIDMGSINTRGGLFIENTQVKFVSQYSYNGSMSSVTQPSVIDGLVSGNGSLYVGTSTIFMNSPGKLTLLGNNTFAGGITMASGTLVLGTATSAGTGALTFAANTQNRLEVQGSGVNAVIHGLDSDDTIDLQTLTLDSTSAPTKELSSDGKTLTVSAGQKSVTLKFAEALHVKSNFDFTKDIDESVLMKISTPDLTAPTVSIATETVVRDQAVKVTSNEVGTVYLVKADKETQVTDAGSFEALVTNKFAAKAEATLAGHHTSVQTQGLTTGAYVAFAVDNAGNVSKASTQTVKVVTLPAVTVLKEDLAFTENDPALVVASTLTLTDEDGSAPSKVDVYLYDQTPYRMGSAGNITIMASNPPPPASESLVFKPNATLYGAIDGTYDSVDGVLRLTDANAGKDGAATLAQWQAALQSVTYENTAEIAVGTRRVEFYVYDGELDMNDSAWRDIVLTDVPDAPEIAGVPANATIVKVGEAAAWGDVVKFSDLDSDFLTVKLTAVNGSIDGLKTFQKIAPNVQIQEIEPGTYEMFGDAQLLATWLEQATFTLKSAGQGSVKISVTDGDTEPVIKTFQFASQVVTPPVTVPTTPPAPGVPAAPNPTTDTSDGVPIQRGTIDGVSVIVVPVVTNNRNDDPSSVNSKLADIEVVKSVTGTSLLTVSLPVGTGVSTAGSGTLVTGSGAQNTWEGRIGASSAPTTIFSAGQTFLKNAPSSSEFVIQTITPTAQLSGSTLQIGANNSDGHLTMLVIDTSGVSGNTRVQLDNVDFAAIIGATRVTGGAGANTVFGDAATQFIVLGEDDDVLHGGGGDDTVGSLRGNDQVFGDEGNDVVYGGSGNDTLNGGTGNDALNGGFGFDTGVQAGARGDYTVRTENGSVILTHRTSGEVDRFTDVERITFDSGKAIVIAHEAGDVATLRAQYANDDLIELNLTRAIIGAEGNDVITPELGVGRNIDLDAGVDVVKLAGGRDDVHLDVEAGQITDLTRLEDGAMLSLKNVELLAFANGDVTVLAQNNDQAILGRAYELLLGRNVDVDGFQFWAEALNAGVSLQSVLQSIVTSQEAADVYKLANGNFIEQLYVQGLDRASDAAGKTYWADALASGVSRAVVLEGFAGSAEAVEVIGSTVDVNVVS